ncbi:MAG: Fibronectin type protein [Candidatus Saccharibacteria bacterium]|nr:Fibronectin type protein [Candidatus Saccharibacteria bacterium]
MIRRASILLIIGLAFVWAPATAYAAGAFPNQQGSGSVGLQGTISTAAPTRAATITTPSNGAVFTTVPIAVNGTCPANVLVKIFANNVFVGSAFCAGGSYSVQASLFSGQNDLVARVYDALDQSGPDSNVVSVIFNDAQFAQFGTRVTLSSVYAQRGTPPGQELTWPILLSGGTGPYAISVDWGDGTSADLSSQDIPGTITIKHTYKTAGIYTVIIKAIDKNGGTAFLQLVGQATGATQNTSGRDSGANSIVKKEILWWPALAMLPLIFGGFWTGRRSELFSLRKQLEKSRDQGKL